MLIPLALVFTVHQLADRILPVLFYSIPNFMMPRFLHAVAMITGWTNNGGTSSGWVILLAGTTTNNPILPTRINYRAPCYWSLEKQMKTYRPSQLTGSLML